MSWTHSSEKVLGVLLAVALVATGTAAALSVTGSAPEPAQVGATVSMNATIEQPFAGEDVPAQYTLRGVTQLENATFTVVALDQQNNQVDQKITEGPTFEMRIALDNNVNEVKVEVEDGEVPNLTEFDYRNKSVENYTAFRLVRVNNGVTTTIETFRSHRYTQASRNARQAIAAAQKAIGDSGGGKATTKLNQAINAYNSENFELARDLAKEAKKAASGGLPILLIGGALVVLLAVGGGVAYYMQSDSGEDYKLQ